MSDLKKIIQETQEAFKQEPSRARAVFESRSVLGKGLRSTATMRHHEITVDEPESLGGSDAGPNPVELILAALGTCQEITYRAYATALGIDLQSVSVSLRGDIDLRGFFAVDDKVRPGYESIFGDVEIVSDASVEELNKLKEAVNAHCPVLDIIAKPVPVDLGIIHMPATTWENSQRAPGRS
ncbi:MAG: OsmC family protein [Pseudomonadota bacterium]